MKLKKALPSNRTYDQVLNHYLVEKEIAQRIKEAKPEDRKKIYATMYDQLFEKVPDHPRLTVRDNIQLTQKSNNSKYSHIKNLIGPQTVFAEFAPGDGKFAAFMAKHVKHGPKRF